MVFPTDLIAISCIGFRVNDSEVVEVGMCMLSDGLHFHFGLCKYTYSRRQPTVPGLLSIIIVTIIVANINW